MKTLAVVILSLATLAGLEQPNPDLPRAEVVIRNISVLGPSATIWLRDRDVIIRHGRIAAVQPAGRPVPPSKFTINGQAKFAIPGLFDTRAHLQTFDRAGAGGFVAHGITSVSDTGTDADKIARWQRDISHGKFMGPRIVRSDAASAPQQDRSAAALHEDLAARVRAGQSPAEVLRNATIDAAIFHGRGHDLGSVEPGKIADLIVLGGDPLADIAHTRSIDAVVFRGEALTRAHLNQLLSQARLTGSR